MSAHDAAQGPGAPPRGVSRQRHSLHRRVEPLARVFRRTSGQGAFCPGRKEIMLKLRQIIHKETQRPNLSSEKDSNIFGDATS